LFLYYVCLQSAAALLVMVSNGSLWRISRKWSFAEALRDSALPAAVYALQNTLLQLSYRHLDSLTFSLLNQTKLVFTAVFMFLILGYRQTKQQVGALLMLLVAAMLLSLGQSSPNKQSKQIEQEAKFMLGIVPILAASVLSGLGSTLCQWAGQVKPFPLFDKQLLSS
jgi:UDP-sugar transporter A1/2/3